MALVSSMPGLLVWTRHSDTVFSISCQCQMWWSRCFHKLVFFHIWSRTRQRQNSYRREHRPNTRRYRPVWDNPVHPPSSPKAGVDPLACISNACTPLGFHPCSRNCPAHESIYFVLCVVFFTAVAVALDIETNKPILQIFISQAFVAIATSSGGRQTSKQTHTQAI